MEVTEKIKQLIEEKYASDEAYADCYTLEVGLKPGNKLEVLIDCDSGVTFQKCQVLSRYLETFLDENGWLGEKYVLEVGSPGVSRPLQLPRQYQKNIGRTLQITKNDGAVLLGELTLADEQAATITFEEITKEGKKKTKAMVTQAVPYTEIKKAVVKVVFK